MTTSASTSSSSSSSNIIQNLLTLPVTHPSHLSLLKSHKPCIYPSLLDSSSSNKWVGRINTAILSREDISSRNAACGIAREVIQQDTEGWAIGGWGKNWVTACLSVISSQNAVVESISEPLHLLEAIILNASQYPSFERDHVLPIMGKLSVTLTRLLGQTLSETETPWTTLNDILQTTRTVLTHSPSPFRPSLPSLKALLLPLILHTPIPPSIQPNFCPQEIRILASNLYATLHLCGGKANTPTAWKTDITEVLSGLSHCLTAISTDGWVEEPPRLPPPPPPTISTSTSVAANIPPFPVDPTARLILALESMEGYTEIIISLLRNPSTRAVPIPIAQLISISLRYLNITIDTPTVPYISPHHHASLITSLPRIWSTGILVIGSTMVVVGDHIFPHLSDILDHTIYLLEKLPLGMVGSQIQMLRFLGLVLELYNPGVVGVEYPIRMLKWCLMRLGGLLDKNSSSWGMGSGMINGGGNQGDAINGGLGGRKGKKRARGFEDGLVGGLEGRGMRIIGEEEGEVVLEVLKLMPLLHTTPLLSPSLLTFSIRLHLSIYLNMSSLVGTFQEPGMWGMVQEGVQGVLERAVLMSEEGGTGRGWKSTIMGVLDNAGGRFNILLHPSLPPLHRPAPPLSSLHYFAPEGEEEKKLRLEMGFANTGDGEEDEDEDMQELEDPVRKRQAISNSQNNSVPIPAVTSSGAKSNIFGFSTPISQSVSSAGVNFPPPIPAVTSTTDTAGLKIQQPAPGVILDTAKVMEEQPLEAALPVPVEEDETMTHFISTTTTSTTKVATTVEGSVSREINMKMNNTGDEDDEEIPDLDSGSSDEEDEEEGDVEEDDRQVS